MLSNKVRFANLMLAGNEIGTWAVANPVRGRRVAKAGRQFGARAAKESVVEHKEA